MIDEARTKKSQPFTALVRRTECRLTFQVVSDNHSRFILGQQEQLDHFTPPHAFDSENRATMTVNG